MKDKIPEHVEPEKPWPRPDKKIDTGGPAFPQMEKIWDEDKVTWIEEYYPGMTLRDYFATEAMKLYFDQAPKSTRKAERFFISKSAYHMADAMIEARRG